jgi:4-amino-4-deoxy-L-arabinose transferase-like glycosyltransferase
MTTHQPSPSAPLQSSTRDLTPWLLAGILLLSVLLRVGVALYLGDTTPPGKDETSYSTLAMRVATGYGFSFPVAWYPFTPADTPTAHWSFLYTAFAAAVYAVVGWHPLAVRLLSALLSGILLPLVVYALARRALPPRPPLSLTVHRSPILRTGEPGSPLTIDHFLSLLAALLSAVYAYFVLFGATVQTEALFIVSLVWSVERALAVEQSLRRQESVRPGLVITLGISLGLAALFRQSILPWVPVMSLYLLWVGYRQRRLGRAFLALAGAGVVVALFILPFTVRNYLVYDDFLLLNSNAGYAMYSAQHPLHGTSFQAYLAAPLPDDLNPQPQNEAQWDRALMARGLQFIVDDPGRYLLLSLSRVADYFEAWPTSDSSLLFNVGRLLSFTLFLPFMLYGLYLSLRPSQLTIDNSSLTIDRSSFALLYLFIAFYSLLHIQTWAMTRYRLPVDAVLLVFAALGIGDLMDRLAARRRAGHPRMPQAPRIHE